MNNPENRNKKNRQRAEERKHYCTLDRVVMSIAILPMGDEFGYEDGTKGLPQSFHRNLLESELNPSGKDTSKNPTAGSKNNSLSSGATG